MLGRRGTLKIHETMVNYCSLLRTQRDGYSVSALRVYYQTEIRYAPTNELQRERILLGRTKKGVPKEMTI